MQKSEYTQWVFTCTKSNNENFRTSCVICSKLTTAKKAPERAHWHEDYKGTVMQTI